MGISCALLCFVCIFATFSGMSIVIKAEDPYRFFTWTITYGTASPLALSQQVILINGQFPGPSLDCVTNDNIIINVVNNLDQPFLLTWWNLRSANWGRQYLGQQLYLRVYNPTKSLSNDYDIPNNALLCGRAVGRKHP